ncbi:hypothetical protein V6N13_044589 [Hibiscus sabdariffa]
MKRRQARLGVDGWSQVDDSGHWGGFGGRGDLWRRQSRTTASSQADASKKSFGHDNADRRRIWCGMNHFDRIAVKLVVRLPIW